MEFGRRVLLKNCFNHHAQLEREAIMAVCIKICYTGNVVAVMLMLQVFSQEDLNQVTFSSYLERRLVRYLISIRYAVFELKQYNNSLNRHIRSFTKSYASVPVPIPLPVFVPNDCIVKGMGLVMAVEGRRASFYIYILHVPNSHPTVDANIADIILQISGPNGDYGEVIIQKIQSRKLKRQSTKTIIQKVAVNSTKSTCNIPINYSLSPTRIRVNYIPQSPGAHELTVLRRGQHVPGSPYPVTIDRKPPELSGRSTRMSDDEVSKAKRFFKKLRVILRVVDFINEKMILTDDGNLHKMSQNNHVPERKARQTDVCISRSSSSDTTDSNDGSNTNLKCLPDSSLSDDLSRKNTDFDSRELTSAEDNENQKSCESKSLSKDLEFFRNRSKKVMMMCRFLIKNSPRQKRLQILSSAGHILDGRPVRLTDKTYNLIEAAVNKINFDHSDNPFCNKESVNDEIFLPDESRIVAADNFASKSLFSVATQLLESNQAALQDINSNIEISRDVNMFNLASNHSDNDLHCGQIRTIQSSQTHILSESINASITSKNIAQLPENLKHEISSTNSVRDFIFEEKYSDCQMINQSTELTYLSKMTSDCEKGLIKKDFLDISKSFQEEICELEVDHIDRDSNTLETNEENEKSGFKYDASNTKVSDKLQSMKMFPQPYLETEQIYDSENECFREENYIDACIEEKSYSEDLLEISDNKLHNAKCIGTVDDHIHDISYEQNENSHDILLQSRDMIVSQADILFSEPQENSSFTDDRREIQSTEMKLHSNQTESNVNLARDINEKENVCNERLKNANLVLEETSNEISEISSLEKSQETDFKSKENSFEDKCVVNNINNDSCSFVSLQSNEGLLLGKEIILPYNETLKTNVPDNCSGVGPASASSPSQDESPTHSTIFPDLEDLLSNDFTAYMISSGNEHQDHQFKLWTSDIAFDSRPTNNLDGTNIDFDSVLSAPNLEEALRKFEQELIVSNIKEASGKLSDVEEVSETSQVANDESPVPVPVQSDESSPVCEEILDINVQGEEEFAEYPGEEENLSYDIGDSDYISLDDLQSSFKHSPENRDDENGNANYNFRYSDLRRNANFKSQENDRVLPHTSNNNSIFNKLMGPAEKEIWGITDYENYSPTEKNNNNTSTSTNVKCYSQVLTPEAPVMTPILEENENIPQIRLEYSEYSCQTVTDNFSIFAPTKSSKNEGQSEENLNSKEMYDDSVDKGDEKAKGKDNTNDYHLPLNVETFKTEKTDIKNKYYLSHKSNNEIVIEMNDRRPEMTNEVPIDKSIKINPISKDVTENHDIHSLNEKILEGVENKINTECSENPFLKENNNVNKINEHENADDVKNIESEMFQSDNSQKILNTEMEMNRNNTGIATSGLAEICENRSECPAQSILEHKYTYEKNSDENMSDTLKMTQDCYDMPTISNTVISSDSLEKSDSKHSDEIKLFTESIQRNDNADLVSSMTDNASKLDKKKFNFTDYLKNTAEYNESEKISQEYTINSTCLQCSSPTICRHCRKENISQNNNCNREYEKTNEENSNFVSFMLENVISEKDGVSSSNIRAITSDESFVHSNTPTVDHDLLTEHHHQAMKNSRTLSPNISQTQLSEITIISNDNTFLKECALTEESVVIDSPQFDNNYVPNHTQQMTKATNFPQSSVVITETDVEEIDPETLLAETMNDNKFANEVDQIFDEIYDSVMKNSNQNSQHVFLDSKDNTASIDILKFEENKSTNVLETKNFEFSAAHEQRDLHLNETSDESGMKTNKDLNLMHKKAFCDETQIPVVSRIRNDFNDKLPHSASGNSFEINHSSKYIPELSDSAEKCFKNYTNFELPQHLVNKNIAIKSLLETPSNKCIYDSNNANKFIYENKFSRVDKQQIANNSEGFPVSMHVNQTKKCWDQKLKENHDIGKNIIHELQDTNKKTMSYSEVYLKICNKYSENSVVNKDKPSIRIAGIVSKCKSTFEKQELASESKGEINYNNQNCGRNVLHWRKYWDNLSRFESRHKSNNSEYKDLNSEKRCVLNIPGLVARGKSQFEEKPRNISGTIIHESTLNDMRSTSEKFTRQTRIELNDNPKIETDNEQNLYSQNTMNVNTECVSGEVVNEITNRHCEHNLHNGETSSEIHRKHNNDTNRNKNVTPLQVNDCSHLHIKEKHAELSREADDELHQARLIHITDEDYRTLTPSSFLQSASQKTFNNDVDLRSSDRHSLKSHYKFDMLHLKPCEYAICDSVELPTIKYEESKAVYSEECKSRFQQAKNFFEILEKKDNISSTNRRRHRVSESSWITSKSLDLMDEESGLRHTNARNWGSAPILQEIQQEIEFNKSLEINPRKKKHCKICGKLKKNKHKLNETSSAPTSDTESQARTCNLKNNKEEEQLGGSERLVKKKVSERFHVKNLFKDVIGDNKSTHNCYFKGVPHKKAVLASLRAMDTSYIHNTEDEKDVIATPTPQSYQQQYPYIPSTHPCLYRPRSSLLTNGLITRKNLVGLELYD